MIAYNQNGISITYYDLNHYLSGYSSNEASFKGLKEMFDNHYPMHYPNPTYCYFNKQFKNNDEALDFFCSTKWPENLNDFIEEVVTKLTEGKLY